MFFKEKGDAVLAPMTGKVISVSDVESPIFSGKVVGDGVAIIPTNGKAVAPVSGIVSFVGEQLHSYGITGFDGVEILIHIGIDSVKLDGVAFTSMVKKGDKVDAGDVLCNVDLDLLKKLNIDITSPVIITSGSMDNIKRLTLSTGDAVAGETVCMRYVRNKK